jgi:hypothetical protein
LNVLAASSILPIRCGRSDHPSAGVADFAIEAEGVHLGVAISVSVATWFVCVISARAVLVFQRDHPPINLGDRKRKRAKGLRL